MSEASRGPSPESQSERIDALRGQLRQAVERGGSSETPESELSIWVERFADLEAALVRREFLLADIAVRRERDETLSADEYHARFPEARTEIDSVFSELASTDMSPAAETMDGGGEHAGDTAAGPPGDLFSAASMAPGGTAAGGSDPAIEQLGDYQLLDKLGEGGMGLVYSARQKSAERVVALKIVRPERLQAYSAERRQNVIDRFRTEAQSAAQLEHENIVTVYDVGEIDGQHYYSMRLVDGCSLADMLAEGPMLNDVAARYLRDTARGIAEAHSRGILHRDLKPQNVMVDSKTDRAMVADFGLAKVVDGDTELTRDGEIVGTPQYMAPEQIRDSARVTASADVYALGATLYHLLTGRPPFQAALAVDTLRQVMMQDPAPPRQVNAAIDLDLETICLKCLEKEPSRRYETAQMVCDELDRYLRNEPILARPLGPMGRAWRWCRRNPGLASAVSAAVLGVMLALAATTIGYVKTSAAQADSDRSFRDALAAVNVFFNKVSEDSLLHAQGMQPLRKELLTLALDYYKGFLEQRANDPTVQRELAGAFYRVGLITAELESPEAALPYFQQARNNVPADSANDLDAIQLIGNIENATGVAYVRLGQLDRALDSFEAAESTRARWKELEPDSVEPLRVLANTKSNVAHAYELRGDQDKALEEFKSAQALREALLDAAADHRRGRRDYAEGIYNVALFRFEVENQKLAEDEEFLAAEVVESLHSDLRRAIELFTQLQSEDAADIGVRFQLSQCHSLVGDILAVGPSAEDAYELAREQLDYLVLQNPTVTRYKINLADLQGELGRLAFAREDFARSVERFKRAIELMVPLAQGDEAQQPRRVIARSYMGLGWAHGLAAEVDEYEADRLRKEAAAGDAGADAKKSAAAKLERAAKGKLKLAVNELRSSAKYWRLLQEADQNDDEAFHSLEECSELIQEFESVIGPAPR